MTVLAQGHELEDGPLVMMTAPAQNENAVGG